MIQLTSEDSSIFSRKLFLHYSASKKRILVFKISRGFCELENKHKLTFSNVKYRFAFTMMIWIEINLH